VARWIWSPVRRAHCRHGTRYEDGQPKILRKCHLPLTGLEVVDMMVTELAVIDVTPEGLVLREWRPASTPEASKKLTEPTLPHRGET